MADPTAVLVLSNIEKTKIADRLLTLSLLIPRSHGINKLKGISAFTYGQDQYRLWGYLQDDLIHDINNERDGKHNC
jgi:hypothetical protein